MTVHLWFLLPNLINARDRVYTQSTHQLGAWEFSSSSDLKKKSAEVGCVGSMGPSS